MAIDETTMRGVVLPGERRVEWRDVPVPEPGPRQVLVRVRASSICGSDIRAIYREHLGVGAEAYQNVIAGHEPAGGGGAVGEGCRRVRGGGRGGGRRARWPPAARAAAGSGSATGWRSTTSPAAGCATSAGGAT